MQVFKTQPSEPSVTEVCEFKAKSETLAPENPIVTSETTIEKIELSPRERNHLNQLKAYRNKIILGEITIDEVPEWAKTEVAKMVSEHQTQDREKLASEIEANLSYKKRFAEITTHLNETEIKSLEQEMRCYADVLTPLEKLEKASDVLGYSEQSRQKIKILSHLEAYANQPAGGKVPASKTETDQEKIVKLERIRLGQTL